MQTAKQIFDFLTGEWEISRNIKSIIPQKKKYIAKGAASFAISKNNPDIILYSENLVMHTPDSNDNFSMTQKYQYKYDMDTLSLRKYFPDGRLFYKLEISGNNISGEHVCIEDHYVSNYIFEKDQLTISYLVSGPNKSYKIITRYKKIG